MTCMYYLLALKSYILMHQKDKSGQYLISQAKSPDNRNIQKKRRIKWGFLLFVVVFFKCSVRQCGTENCSLSFEARPNKFILEAECYSFY